jgi:hypothetical protein
VRGEDSVEAEEVAEDGHDATYDPVSDRLSFVVGTSTH